MTYCYNYDIQNHIYEIKSQTYEIKIDILSQL